MALLGSCLRASRASPQARATQTRPCLPLASAQASNRRGPGFASCRSWRACYLPSWNCAGRPKGPGPPPTGAGGRCRSSSLR
eukprot:3340000-Alexandrium_andersonii.AAC.1